MSDKRDYYEVLGLKKGATDDAIKKAFREKAKQFHPDLNPDNPDAEVKFKEVNEANEVLSNPEKKQRYDSFGHAGVDPSYGGGGGGGFGGFSGFGGFESGGINIDLGDIFDNLFGGGGGSRTSNPSAPRQGADISINLDISFMEACKGVTHEIEVNRQEPCDTCKGSGAKPGTDLKTCTECNGAGRVRYQQRTIFGISESLRPCNRCSGKGKIVETPCSACAGQGRINRREKVKVGVPAGIDSGQILCVRGEGHIGTNGGGRGDLNARISIRRDQIFRREGFDVHCDIPLTYSQAALGVTDMEIPTIDGSVKLTIPEGTQPGKVFRLKGKGIQKLRREGRGDELVKVVIEIPKNLTKQQKDLLRQLDESFTDKNFAKRESFFEKLKKLNKR
ncbi:MAG: molecular chaperone DnaJ [Oscillospiraceae bacterium]|nr:molecular chaperone DnaJ [Oscillospiraceae bacterium]